MGVDLLDISTSCNEIVGWIQYLCSTTGLHCCHYCLQRDLQFTLKFTETWWKMAKFYTPDMWHHCQHLYLPRFFLPIWLQWIRSRNVLWKEAVCDNKIRTGIKELLSIALVWCMGLQMPMSTLSHQSNSVRIKWIMKQVIHFYQFTLKKKDQIDSKKSGKLNKISKKKCCLKRAKIWTRASNMFSLCAFLKPSGQISFRSDDDDSTSMQTVKP